jgi:sugar transferase (PEP-CTERM system associated)
MRTFDYNLSARNTLYFIVENALIVSFLIWDRIGSWRWAEIMFIPLVVQASLRYSATHSSPRVSLKMLLFRYFQAILWSLAILAVVYSFFPVALSLERGGAWIKLFALPFMLVGLRTAYQHFMGEEIRVPVLVIGRASASTRLKEIVSDRAHLGYRIFHLPWEPGSDELLQKEMSRLTEMVSTHRIQKVVMALKDRRRHFPLEVLVNLRVQGIEVMEAVTFFERMTGKIPVESLNPSHLIFGAGFRRVKSVHVAKRTVDIVLSAIGLILALPIICLLSILIKLDSRGPIFYRQERLGEKGRPFVLTKFRSMQVDAEAQSGPVWASQNDPRVTRTGRIMRKLRLDEIPQLLNVIKGEMSFVGPRPERAVFVAKLRSKIPYYDLRFTVKPGLTGWAQVKYTYGADEEDALEKVRYELYYIKHLSLFFDLRIILQTVQVVLGGRGAR